MNDLVRMARSGTLRIDSLLTGEPDPTAVLRKEREKNVWAHMVVLENETTLGELLASRDFSLLAAHLLYVSRLPRNTKVLTGIRHRMTAIKVIGGSEYRAVGETVYRRRVSV